MIKKMAAVASVLLLMTASVHANTNLDIDLEGTLLPPVCVVHDGNNGPMEVDFGEDMNINRLNGTNYRQEIKYDLTCGTDGQQWQLRFKFIGTGNTWDNQALVTSDKDLGIRLLLDGNVVDFNRDIPVNGNIRPLLSAVPVKNTAIMPKEGVFNATANLLAEYY